MALAVDTPLRAPAPTSPRPSVPRMRRRLGIVAIIASASAMGLAGVFGRLASPPGAVIGETLTLGRMAVGALGMVVILAAGGRLHVLRRLADVLIEVKAKVKFCSVCFNVSEDEQCRICRDPRRSPDRERRTAAHPTVRR